MVIGVLAEDRTDCEAIGVLIRRIVPRPPGQGIGVKMRGQGGCSRLHKKAVRWMRELVTSGCVALVLVRDLDRHPVSKLRNDEDALKKQLEALEVPLDAKRHICIPVEELEAWFWSDQGVLDRVTKGTATASPSPHQIESPKEKLISASCGANRRPIYSTNDNKKLAEFLDLDLCAERCPSFRELRKFVETVAG